MLQYKGNDLHRIEKKFDTMKSVEELAEWIVTWGHDHTERQVALCNTLYKIAQGRGRPTGVFVSLGETINIQQNQDRRPLSRKQAEAIARDLFRWRAGAMTYEELEALHEDLQTARESGDEEAIALAEKAYRGALQRMRAEDSSR